MTDPKGKWEQQIDQLRDAGKIPPGPKDWTITVAAKYADYLDKVEGLTDGQQAGDSTQQTGGSGSDDQSKRSR
jgi:hypothetical protein